MRRRNIKDYHGDEKARCGDGCGGLCGLKPSPIMFFLCVYLMCGCVMVTIALHDGVNL